MLYRGSWYRQQGHAAPPAALATVRRRSGAVRALSSEVEELVDSMLTVYDSRNHLSSITTTCIVNNKTPSCAIAQTMQATETSRNRLDLCNKEPRVGGLSRSTRLRPLWNARTPPPSIPSKLHETRHLPPLEMILARKRANLTHQQRGSNATYGTYASQAQDAPSPSHAALWSLAARPGPSALYIDIKGYNSAQPFLSRAHQRFRAHDDVKQQAALQAATKPLSGAGDEASWPSGLPSRHSILDK